VQAEAVVGNALVTLTAGVQAGAKEGFASQPETSDGFLHARTLLNDKTAPRADRDVDGHAFEQASRSSPVCMQLLSEMRSNLVRRAKKFGRCAVYTGLFCHAEHLILFSYPMILLQEESDQPVPGLTTEIIEIDLEGIVHGG
jgi:hypothetical protein